ncbi:MAG: SixA phosphatase family protein [Rhizobiaceae bacterium]
MTRLYVLRHAKAAAALPGMRDIDRPLEAAGRIAAAALGVKLRNDGITPDKVICSMSMRTRQTLDNVAQFFLHAPQTEFDPEMYGQDWPGYLESVRNDSGAGALMLVGHNPACEDIVHQLVGRGDKQALGKMLDGFAPGTLAAIDFDVPFAQVGARSGYLENIWLDGCVRR